MTIKQRGETAQRAEKISKGRHPILKHGSNNLLVWRHIESHPGCTRRNLEDLPIHNSRIRTCVSLLMQAGLVGEQGYERYSSKSKQAKLYIMEGRETGIAREAVRVRLGFFENNLGQFSVIAKLIGESDTAKQYNPRLIKTKEVLTFLPRPEETTSQEVIPLTIIEDIDYTVIPNNDSDSHGE